jgi:hypothetical protein
MNFSADGRHLVTGGREGTVLIWAVTAAVGPRPGEHEIKGLWADLGDDPAKALRAMQRLSAVPAQAVELVRGRLKPAVLVELLEALGTPVARDLLTQLRAGNVRARLTREAADSLRRLEWRAALPR